MNFDDFRARAHQLVDWMADYLETVERRDVLPKVAPGEVIDELAAHPPEQGEPFEAIFRDFEKTIMPGMTHWQHPSFFAYFPANSSPPSVLAEMLTATLGAQCMSWQTSPAATELEQRVMEWLREMLGLDQGFDGVIQDTASSATLCALLTARERATGFAVNRSGLQDRARLKVYCSEEAHSSVEKAVGIAGLGRDSLCKIPVDANYAMSPAALDAAILRDRAGGEVPACVIATLGTTGSSAIDPLKAIGEIARRYGVWLHVDAAWAGAALLLPEHRSMIDGVANADSFVFNPHKWLFTNFDCSAYFVRDTKALLRTMSISPEYLKTVEAEEVRNYRDWGVALGRRFRALKLWFVIRSYGVARLRQMLATHIEMARELAREIDLAGDFELMAPAPLALVCFRYRPNRVVDGHQLDGLNQELLRRLNESGRAFVSHTRLSGRFVLRVAIGQTYAEPHHVDSLWRQVRATARTINLHDFRAESA